MPNEHEVTLENLGNGAAEELIQTALQEVIKNILDPNTKATAKREIILTITMQPDDRRTSVGSRISVKTKLVAVSPHVTVLYPAQDGDRYVMTETNPKQPSLFPTAEQPPAPPKLVKAGDNAK